MRNFPPSPMHQPTEYEAYVDELMDRNNLDINQLGQWKLSYPMTELARACLINAYEYADDGSNPVELCDICNSELDFIDWFIDEIEDPSRCI